MKLSSKLPSYYLNRIIRLNTKLKGNLNNIAKYNFILYHFNIKFFLQNSVFSVIAPVT